MNQTLPTVKSGFAPPPSATTTNRVNTSGAALPDKRNRVSNVYNVTVPAAVNGVPGVLPQVCTGTQFYVLYTSAPINIRPSKGSYNSYNTGQGLQLDDENAFTQVEFQNSTANPIVVSLFVGWQEFIDRTLILNNVTTPSVVNPTAPVPNVAAFIDIPDLSGTTFTDVNGKKWIAINRVAIIISNADTATSYLVQKYGSRVSNGNAIAIAYPSTALRLDISGNYTLATGGANVNAVVSEIYNAIPATS